MRRAKKSLLLLVSFPLYVFSTVFGEICAVYSMNCLAKVSTKFLEILQWECMELFAVQANDFSRGTELYTQWLKAAFQLIKLLFFFHVF